MNAHRLLTVALDPSLILRAQGMTPDPWQRDLLLSPAPRLLLNCSRGAGKSRTCSALALHTALFRPGSLTLLLSRALRQAMELLRYVKQGWRARGRLVCLSTPFGARGFFWREWHDTRADWKRVHITWRACPRIAAEAIADERRAMGDLWVAQEYEGSFVSMEGLVYPDFGRALLDQETVPEGRPVGGIDFGWRNPFAALWGVLDSNDVLWIDGERYGSQVPLHQHAAALREQRHVTWYADPSGG